MRAVDRKYFDKYAVDPFNEEFMLDSFAEGWVDDIGDDAPNSNEFLDDEWDDLV